MENISLDSKLKEIRVQAKKTVPEVSQYLTSLGHKASEKTVYSWEAGRSRPTIDIFLDMCRFYGVTDIFSYFGSDPIETKNSPSTAEAASGEEDIKLMNYIKRGIYDMGFLPEGADLTDRQLEALLGVCAILHAIFDE